MNIYESGEMYLEAIYVLQQKKGTVRSIDVADYLGYSKPSVSRGMGLLRQGNLITTDKNGTIHLTEEGQTLAEKIYDRHVVLAKALMALGIPEEAASADACRIEHVISDASFEALKEHLSRMEARL